MKQFIHIIIGMFLAILVSGNVWGQCVPSFSNTSDYIANVTFSEISNSTGCSTNGYGDYTSMVANVDAGSTISIYVKCVDDGIGSHGLAVWIDLNGNAIFENNERIGAVNMPNNSSTTISYIIPQNQPNGIYTMRVIYRYNEIATSINPCVSGGYGEGEDYSIQIGESQIINPNDPQWINCFDFENNTISTRFENDNTYPWTIINNAPNNNTYCLKSGNSNVHNSSSTISLTINFDNSGAISFDAGIYGEGSSDTYDWDKCRFYIDDVLQFDYGAHGRWEHFEYNISTGTHTFKWTYKKDGSVHPTGDAFFIDNLCFDADMFLPITLRYFNATPRSDGKNLLKWVTGYEYQNANFEIFRTNDILLNQWESMVTLWQGTTDKPRGDTYMWLDEQPYDTTYYMLVQNDLDGGFETFRSEMVVCIQQHKRGCIEPSVTCYGVPQATGGSDQCEVYVQNVLGQLVEEFTLQPYQTRDITPNVSGAYLVTFVYEHNGQTYKLTEKVICM